MNLRRAAATRGRDLRSWPPCLLASAQFWKASRDSFLHLQPPATSTSLQASLSCSQFTQRRLMTQNLPSPFLFLSPLLHRRRMSQRIKRRIGTSLLRSPPCPSTGLKGNRPVTCPTFVNKNDCLATVSSQKTVVVPKFILFQGSVRLLGFCR